MSLVDTYESVGVQCTLSDVFCINYLDLMKTGQRLAVQLTQSPLLDS